MANSIIYRDLLLKQRHGLPLWKPDPDANLPEVYTKRGIRIGDLGLLTDDGGFDYLFNIHADAQDPVNQHLGTPLSFRPLPLDPTTEIKKTTSQHPKKACITRNASFKVKSNIGESIAVVPAVDISLAVEFTITEDRAAILVLPHGADRYEAKAYGKYRTYVLSHAKSWYEHLNQVEQREARNGSLYLVTGCDKACSWGLAAGMPHQERTVGFNVTTGSLASGTVGIHASWRNTGGVESRHYPPSITDISEDMNQCVFARGFVIGINKNYFKKKWAGLVRTDHVASSPKPFPPIGSNVPFHSPPGRNALLANTVTPSRSQNLANNNNSDTISDVIVSDSPDYPKPVLSPGSYICEHLLSSRSDIEVIMVHDDDWIMATADNHEKIFTLGGTDYKHLTARVLEMYHPLNSVSAFSNQQDPVNSSRQNLLEALRVVSENITRSVTSVSATSSQQDPVRNNFLPESRRNFRPSHFPEILVGGNAPNRYPSSYPHSGYPPNHYPSSYPPSGYPPNGYPPNGYPPGGYPPNGYPPGGYPPNGYPPNRYPPSGYPPSGYPPSGYPPSGYPPSGYPPSSYLPSSYPPHSYPAASGYPQPSYYPASGSPAQAGYPPPNVYPATSGYPALSGNPAPGTYPAQGGSPTAGRYYPTPNNGSSYPRPSYYPSNLGGHSSGGRVQASTTTPVRDAVVIDSPPPAQPPTDREA